MPAPEDRAPNATLVNGLGNLSYVGPARVKLYAFPLPLEGFVLPGVSGFPQAIPGAPLGFPVATPTAKNRSLLRSRSLDGLLGLRRQLFPEPWKQWYLRGFPAIGPAIGIPGTITLPSLVVPEGKTGTVCTGCIW